MTTTKPNTDTGRERLVELLLDKNPLSSVGEIEATADAILAAGWRPPLPELRTVPSPWDAYRQAYEAFQRENPSWRAHFTMHHMHALDAALRAFEVFDDGKCQACGRTYPETGEDVIVHFEGRPVVGRRISVQQGWDGDQFVELPRDFAVPASPPATVEVDDEADAWYVRILDEPVHHTTESAPVNLDWTRDGRLVGVELLGPLRRQSSPLPDSETEWGYRIPDGFVSLEPSEAMARRWVDMAFPGQRVLVRREVGPWIEVQS